MDGIRFDDLTRTLAGGASRRGLLKGLVGGLAASFAGVQAGAARRPARLPTGEPCTRPTDCASFVCANGVCCDSACTGQCESCASGTCTPVTGSPDTDKPACPGDGPCAAACDGVATGHCAGFPDAEVVCGESTCADGWQTVYACGGNGFCVPTVTSCAPFGCDRTGVACATGCASDADCGSGAHCDDGECLPNEGLGRPCDADSGCVHGFCVDRVCCVERCGACQACNLPGNEGFCAPGPDGGECAGGLCCEGGCVDVQTDVEHCGGCDSRCPGIQNGFAVCANGACGFACAAGHEPCGDACVDTQTDPANCGGCDDVCDDSDPCSTVACVGGACMHTPIDCSALDGECTVGTCDAATGRCVEEAAHQGESCNNPGPCMTGGTCDAGACVGVSRDCGALDTACLRGVCDLSTDTCITEVKPDQIGQSCDDGDVCSEGSTCQTDGRCGGGAELSCSTPPECQSLPGTCSQTHGGCAYAMGINDVHCDGGAGRCLFGSCVPCTTAGGTICPLELVFLCCSGSCHPVDGLPDFCCVCN